MPSPLLRFKDEHGNHFPDWEEKTLGAICNCFSGGTPTSGKRDYYGGSIPFIRSAEIDAQRTALFLTEKGLKESAAKMVEEGDLLVALYGANSGEVGISKITGAINQAILCVRTKQSTRFLYFWLEFSKHSIVNTYLQGGQGNLSGKIVQTLNIELPTLPEQRKIAGFLTAVDGRIGQLSQKKALLEDYKRGVMQQLFTQALRFKDEHGNDFPDWEEKTLGEVSEIVNGLTYSPEDVASEGLLVLRSSNVQDGKVVLGDNVFVKVSVNDWNMSRPNDILICVRNGSKTLIGKNAIIPEGCPPATHGAFMTVLRGTQNHFVFQLLQTDAYKRNVHINLGATINSINGSDLKKFKFVFPSLPEQTKIANFLSALDRKIESVSSQIRETQAFKKGLLQQMFV